MQGAPIQSCLMGWNSDSSSVLEYLCGFCTICSSSLNFTSLFFFLKLVTEKWHCEHPNYPPTRLLHRVIWGMLFKRDPPTRAEGQLKPSPHCMQHPLHDATLLWRRRHFLHIYKGTAWASRGLYTFPSFLTNAWGLRLICLCGVDLVIKQLISTLSPSSFASEWGPPESCSRPLWCPTHFRSLRVDPMFIHCYSFNQQQIFIGWLLCAGHGSRLCSSEQKINKYSPFPMQLPFTRGWDSV